MRGEVSAIAEGAVDVETKEQKSVWGTNPASSQSPHDSTIDGGLVPRSGGWGHHSRERGDR
jgi:hypothetical protein